MTFSWENAVHSLSARDDRPNMNLLANSRSILVIVIFAAVEPNAAHRRLNGMGDFCGYGWRSNTGTTTSQAVADYLAGYAEALADTHGEHHPAPDD